MDSKRISKKSLRPSSCQRACPAGIDVPRYIRYVKAGKFDEALAVIREKIPFPHVCGYACYSPCEANCGNKQFGEAIAIRALKRTAAERGGELWKKNLKLAPDTGKKVAVVGSGPGGLTAAYYLATLGHQVTVFEENDAPGGMLRMGIPEYRLPRTALDQEIDYLKELGVALKLNSRVASIGELLEEADAVFLACGAQGGARLDIPGDDSPGVIDGISFLKTVNRGRHMKTGNRVAVIGGGNTAVDATRSAIRLGARDVVVKYRRSQAEMTAYEEEVGNARYEGVQFDCLTAPVRIVAANGRLTVTFNRMKLGAKDAGGRPVPVPIKGSEYTEEFDMVVAAVGQYSDIPRIMKLPAGERGFVRVDPETLATDRPGVFAGGDLVTGPASIIEAIAQGRRAAASIDRFLGGRGRIDQELLPPEEEVIVLDYTCDGKTRVTIPCAPITERVTGFTAVEKDLSEGAAMKEAQRCRGCDAREFMVTVYDSGCKDCSYCMEVCQLGVFESSERFNEKGYRSVQAAHPERCVGCMQCFYACPDFSIEVKVAG